MAIASKMEKAELKEKDGSKSLEFKFNPTDYSVSKSATWEKNPASKNTKSGGKPHFVSSNPETVNVKIFFDESEDSDGDVTTDVEQLFKWLSPTDKSINDSKSQPPTLTFTWGSNMHLRMKEFYLSDVSATYTMFRRDGTPIRAEATIKLNEIPTDDPGGQNPTSGSINTRRVHQVGEGDSLQSIAYREYGAPALWRGIAIFNDLDDPMRLRLGSELLLPSLEEAAELVKRPNA